MKLSIIIPVYQVEATLDRCIESVVRQSYADFELILVDDGSTDRSPEMCDDWQERDGRISVIHQPNGGLSEARNSGIERATGDYLTFVDSDDYLAPHTLAPLMDILSRHPEYDLLEYPIEGRFASADTVFEDIGMYWLQTKAYTHSYAWNKVYRRELFREVRFPEGKLFEDAYTLPQLLRQSRRVALTTKGCYHYESNPLGITATAGGAGLKQLLAAHLSNGMPTDDRYYMYLLNIQMDVCELTSVAPTLPYRAVDISSQEGISRFKAIALKLFGIKGICKLNKVIHQVWKSGR